MDSESAAVSGPQTADIETLILPYLPDSPVFIGLFLDLKNAPFLRQQLLASNHEFEYALIDATSVLTRRHVLAAVFRAINDARNGRLKSNNVHSEIVYSLGGNNNITDAFRHFGITDRTTSLLAIKVGSASDSAVTRESVASHLLANFEGRLRPFTDETVLGISDVPKIRKLYRVTTGAAGKGGKRAKMTGVSQDGTARDEAGPLSGQIDDRAELEAVVLGTMAMKGS